MEAKDIFLEKIEKRVLEGEFDSRLNIPFTSKKLLISAITDKVNRRELAGKTPMLTDAELNVVVDEVREAGAATFSLFEKYGFWEKDKDGALRVSKKGMIAIKQSHLL
jgi:hypothetical protein